MEDYIKQYLEESLMLTSANKDIWNVCKLFIHCYEVGCIVFMLSSHTQCVLLMFQKFELNILMMNCNMTQC